MQALPHAEKLNNRSTTSKSPSKTRRNRGVILTLHGWDKLQAAKARAEFDENDGNRFTLEELSDRTDLASHTITKVLKRTEPVDKQSLQYAFRTFGLELSKSDYTHPTSLFKYAQQGVLVFEQIRSVLDGQFNRLSAVELEVMYWMAINREPVSLTELEQDIVTVASKRKLLEAMNSLLIRSLIEKDGEYFWVQPVVMEYVTQRLAEQDCNEIETQQIERLRSHASVKVQAKNYVREVQEIRLWRASA